jgi:transcriptional regulator with XRE-family HTH domain
MTVSALIALRKSRGLSLRSASREWGVTATTIYRWENGLRPIPAWIERMVERERPLLKQIESQEREIAALLLRIHRQLPDSRPERLPMSVARIGGQPKALRRRAGGHRAHV